MLCYTSESIASSNVSATHLFELFGLQDEKILIWYSGEKEKHLNLDAVSKVISGQQTVCIIESTV